MIASSVCYTSATTSTTQQIDCMQPFAINSKELLKEAWEVFKKHWKIVLGMVLLTMLPSVIFSSTGSDSETSVSFIGDILSLYTAPLATIVILKVLRGQTPSMDDATAVFKRIWPYFKTNVRTFLIVFAGFLLLVIPGIYFAFKYMFAPTLAIDGEDSSAEAMRKSAVMTNGYKMQLFLFGLVVLVFNLVGLLALVVGAVVTSAVSMLAYLMIYERLKAQQLEQGGYEAGASQAATAATQPVEPAQPQEPQIPASPQPPGK